MDDDSRSPAEDIPAEEERLFARVMQSLAAAAAQKPAGSDKASGRARAYDAELMALRDEIGEARLEDVPALIAQMERLQEVSLTRADLQTMLVDPRSPYFGHLRLRERVGDRGEVERDVFIGRATFTDPRTRIAIVDWRNAPVSQLYYRYSEGSDYEETFGEREVEGDVLVRRTVTIQDGTLLRIACPQGIWVKRRLRGQDMPVWERMDVPLRELAGGERTATRPIPRRGMLGSAREDEQRLDRHLPEIAALIDPRQFEIMTAPHSGVVVIQGGAGSGKTTIGLHRLAYLGFAFPDRFPAKRMVVVTQGTGLAAYIGQVLPALGLPGVRVVTFDEWAERELHKAIPWIHATLARDVLPAVTRVKSHPALLHELERKAAARKGKRGSRAAVELWADLLTDRGLLLSLLRNDPEMPVSEAWSRACRPSSAWIRAIAPPRRSVHPGTRGPETRAKTWLRPVSGRPQAKILAARRWIRICPRACGATKASATRWTQTRTCAARLASTGSAPRTINPCSTPTIWPSCCEPINCCGRGRPPWPTCLSTRPKIFRP
jgi:DNA helicase-2/ATP-dependent DNA helicase PcrA